MTPSMEHCIARAGSAPLAALLLLSAFHSVHAAGINLSWDDCGTHGVATKTFTCDTNAGSPFTLVGSFVAPPGVNEFLGMSATLNITTPDALPDWWKHGESACRGQTGLAASFDFVSGPSSCFDFYSGRAVGGFAYDIAFGAPNRARLRIQSAVPIDNRGPVSSVQETYAFKLELLRSNTTGPGSCVGCTAAANIELTEIQLFQPPESAFDPILTDVLDDNDVAWQGEFFFCGRPVVSSFAPTSGPVGTLVTLLGSCFTGTSSVRFGGTDAAFTVVGDTVISTSVPIGGITGPIRVTIPLGNRATDSLFIVAPYIQSFAPAQAPIGHSITIAGTNFTRTTSVMFDGTPALFVERSNSNLEAIVPSGTTNGPITVTNPGGSDSSEQVFTVGPLLQPPTLSSFSPPAGTPGTKVTLQGLALFGASLVTFGGVGSTFSVLSDTTISAVVPAGARTGPINVSNPVGTATSSSMFIVSPEIVQFTPHEGLIGWYITIYGHNFTGTSRVLFNGAAAAFGVYSDSFIVARVPDDATNGPLTVANLGGSDISEESFRLLGGINLSWDDCGPSGSELKTFACDSNPGSPFSLIGSFRPPQGVAKFLGYSAELDLLSTTIELPDWWKHGTSFCRGDVGLSTSFDFTSGPHTCTDPFAGQATGGFAYDVGFGGLDRARLSIQAEMPINDLGPIHQSNEYYAFKVLFHRSKTAGADSCAGCAIPMRIVLNEIQLFQPPESGFSPSLSNPLNRSYVFWQDNDICETCTPVLAEATSIEADARRVRVVWSTGHVEAARIYRRESNREWRALATMVPDGSHRIIYEDADIVAGGSYSYRLGIEHIGGEIFAGEISITVAGASSLELSGIVLESDGLQISLSLASTTPATIEIYDLSGRRRITNRLAGLGVGTHRAHISGARRLESGVYFARLQQDDRHVTRRFSIAR